MCWQRPIFQAAGHPDPALAVGVHDEWLIAAEGIIAFRANPGLVIGRLGGSEIRRVEPGPRFLLFVPPNQFLALAPGAAIGTRGSTVVQNAPVRRPGESPAMAVQTFWLPLPGFVFARRWHDAGVDPATTGGGTVIL